MIIVSYEKAADFLAVMQEKLEENESANNLMLGILQRQVRHPDWVDHLPFLRTCHNARGLVAAAVMTPPHNLIIYREQTNTDEAFELIAFDLLLNRWNPPGVIGPSDIAQRFAAKWSQICGMKHLLKTNLRIYECDSVTKPAHVKGALRLAGPEDLDLLSEWIHGFQNDIGDPIGLEDASQMIQRRIQNQDAYIWEEGGVPVSMVIKNRPIAHSISVTGVYTPPDLRKRGYASACVSTLTEKLLEVGYRAVNLYTDLANPTSNSIYQRMGYIPIMDWKEFRFYPKGTE
ncbi:MAG: GNAT family N-acetyltransferase [Anaerolineaceae bacterium]|nr:GNAT family N-acetyltransferase [Anaerolineaceae bacterium]